MSNLTVTEKGATDTEVFYVYDRHMSFLHAFFGGNITYDERAIYGTQYHSEIYTPIATSAVTKVHIRVLCFSLVLQ